MFECVCEDQAIEDTVYALDDTLQKGKIDVDTYTKQIRSLSRRQFYARALAGKIHSKQTESQSMGAGAMHSHSARSLQHDPNHPANMAAQMAMGHAAPPAPHIFANYMR